MVEYNLPEIDKYCGLCNLRTGIYSKSVLTLIILVSSIIANTFNLLYTIQWGRYLYQHDVITVPEHLVRNITENELDGLKALHRSLVAFFVVWLIFKGTYVFVVLSTVWAVYKKKAKMLRVLMYVNIPNWIFDFLMSVLSGVFSDKYLKIALYVSLLAETYNLLAIRSEYNRLTGKSGFIRQSNTENETIPRFVSPPHRTLPIPARNDIHCRTCTCHVDMVTEDIPVTSQPRLSNVENVPRLSTPEESPPAYDNKELNFKEQPIIYNQNQLVEGCSSVVDHNSDSHASRSSDNFPIARPMTLSLRSPEDIEEKKVDMSDIPVIYDEDQLNVGSSPVIEDRY